MDADVTVIGTQGNDSFEFTPIAADAGQLLIQDIDTRFYLHGVPEGSNSLRISGGAGGWADEVSYVGSDAGDFMLIDGPGRIAALEAISFSGQRTPLRSIELDASTSGNIEILNAIGLDGADTFVVIPAQAVGNGLFINVDGGASAAVDALIVSQWDGSSPTALAATDFAVVEHARTEDSGQVRMYRNAVAMPSIAYENIAMVSPLPSINPTSGDPNLLVLGADLYEQNEYRSTAAYLGSGEVINVEDLAILPSGDGGHLFMPADQDYFRVIAEETGTLDFQVAFSAFNPTLLPGGGNLSVEVLDADGTVIAGNAMFGSHDASGNARVRIPAVAGQTYYLHVYGADSTVINGYDISIAAMPAPVPYDIELDDIPVGDNPAANSDTGRSQFDNVTRDSTPVIVFRLDDSTLLHDLYGGTEQGTLFDEAIAIPFAGNVLTPGYRIAVFVEGTPQQPGQLPQTLVGYARQTSEGVYEFDFESDTISGTPTMLTDGSHFISAMVEMVDPASPVAAGFGFA